MGKTSIKNSRNVLALPEEPFWPALDEPEIETSLLKEFTETLKVAKTIQPRFKWSEVRKINKEEKVKQIEQFFNNLSAEEQAQHKKAKQLKKYLVIGINEVSRGLERKELACCLVHGQAKPKLIITHLIQLACGRKVPVIIVNDLKQSMKESLGFSSLALGFTKDVTVNEKHEFHELCKRIINLYEGIRGNSEEPADTSCNNELKKEEIENIKSTDTDFTRMIVDCSSLYLYRTSSNYRVFHPPDDDSVSDEAEETDISKNKLTTEVFPSESPVPNKKTKFIEPTILRVQSNPNKLRKKKKKKKK